MREGDDQVSLQKYDELVLRSRCVGDYLLATEPDASAGRRLWPGCLQPRRLFWCCARIGNTSLKHFTRNGGTAEESKAALADRSSAMPASYNTLGTGGRVSR